MDSSRILHQLIHLFKTKEEQQFKVTRLSAREWHVLEHIREDNAWRFNDFAENYQIKPSTLTNIIERLERKGLVERIRSEGDRKAVYLHRTLRGNEIVTQHIEEDQVFFDRMLSPLNQIEKEQFIKLAKKITDVGEIFQEDLYEKSINKS